MLSKLVVALAAVAAAAPPPKALSTLDQMTDSYIRRGVKEGFHYGEATLYTGAEAAFAVSKNKTVLDWYRRQVDEGVINDDGSIIDWDLEYYSLDDYRIGNNLLWWYQRTGDEKYRTAADTIRYQLDRHPRNPSGGFWHRKPIYKDQQWLDGIFMADVFYARWTKAFQPRNTTAWDDIILQYDLIEERTRNHTTNLLVHGYDESKTAIWAHPVTGASPLVWNRAVGWYYMALAETIAAFPKSHPGHKRLVKYFTTLSEGLKRAHERDAGWWLVMSEGYPGRAGNYIESSSQAMFVYGLLHGLRTGLLPERQYGKTAEKTYKELIDKFVTKNNDGTLNFIETVQVGSLNSNATFEYYVGVPRIINDNRGGGALLLALAEWELRTK